MAENKTKKAWRYHAEYEPKVFEGEAIEIAERAGWVDSPAKVEVVEGGDIKDVNTNLNDNPNPNAGDGGDSTSKDGGDIVDYKDAKWTKKLLKIECNEKEINFSHLGAKPKNDDLIALLEG